MTEFTIANGNTLRYDNRESIDSFWHFVEKILSAIGSAIKIAQNFGIVYPIFSASGHVRRLWSGVKFEENNFPKVLQ